MGDLKSITIRHYHTYTLKNGEVQNTEPIDISFFTRLEDGVLCFPIHNHICGNIFIYNSGMIKIEIKNKIMSIPKHSHNVNYNDEYVITDGCVYEVILG